MITLIDVDGVATGVAELGKLAVEAVDAEGLALHHDVAGPAQQFVALRAGKVLHVPRVALGLRALVREDQLMVQNGGR